jgi:hypothetical protein
VLGVRMADASCSRPVLSMQCYDIIRGVPALLSVVST